MKFALFFIVSYILATVSLYSQIDTLAYSRVAKEERGQIFADYLQKYCNLQIDAFKIDPNKIQSLEILVKNAAIDSTRDVKEAIHQIEAGNKVVFFADTYVWGGLEMGYEKSGSWGMDFPYASGFYLYKNKAFNDEGLNFHCGKKDKKPQLRFYIFKEN